MGMAGGRGSDRDVSVDRGGHPVLCGQTPVVLGDGDGLLVPPQGPQCGEEFLGCYLHGHCLRGDIFHICPPRGSSLFSLCKL